MPAVDIHKTQALIIHMVERREEMRKYILLKFSAGLALFKVCNAKFACCCKLLGNNSFFCVVDLQASLIYMLQI